MLHVIDGFALCVDRGAALFKRSLLMATLTDGARVAVDMKFPIHRCLSCMDASTHCSQSPVGFYQY